METDLIGLHQYSRTINAWSRSQCKIVHSEQHVCIRQGQSLMYVVSGKDRVSCMCVSGKDRVACMCVSGKDRVTCMWYSL